MLERLFMYIQPYLVGPWWSSWEVWNRAFPVHTSTTELMDRWTELRRCKHTPISKHDYICGDVSGMRAHPKLGTRNNPWYPHSDAANNSRLVPRRLGVGPGSFMGVEKKRNPQQREIQWSTISAQPLIAPKRHITYTVFGTGCKMQNLYSS